MIDLSKELPRLLPLAVGWASSCSREILETGIPLTPRELRLSRAVGVRDPERVRIKIVSTIPSPEDAELRAAAVQAELIGPSTSGLTLGYGIYLVEGFICDRLVRHECRHVHQYEQAGSIEAFLRKYIPDVLQFSYWNAPDEVDARAWENG
jgi:hypothetical protein